MNDKFVTVKYENKLDYIFNFVILFINIYGLYLKIVRYLKYINDKKILRRNDLLKKAKKSKKIFICGMGPSLNDIDFNKIDGDIMVTNHFIKSGISKIINPNYYVLLDNAFYNNKFKVFTDAYKKYEFCKFILNGRYIDMFANYNNDKLYFSDCWAGFFNCNFKLDFTKVSYSYQNVINFCIAYAMYIGYKEIYLLGCDFSLFSEKNIKHCYNEKGKKRTKPLFYDLFGCSIVWKTHYEEYLYAKKNNIKVYNVNRTTLLDIYPIDEKINKKYYK